MLGSLKRDLLVISKDFKIYAPVFLFIVILTGFDINKTSLMINFYLVMMLAGVLSYDEKSNYLGYSISFPNGRENYITSKYVSKIILMVISLIINILIAFISIKILDNSQSIDSIIEIIIIGSSAGIIMFSLLMPLLIKLGSDKGRIIIFVLLFGISFGTSLLISNLNITIPSFIIENLKLTLGIVAIVFFIISYFICQKIIKNKDY